MIFKFPQKKITLHCFVKERDAYVKEYFPIAPCSKYVPDWWKKTSKGSFNWDLMQQEPTVKTCAGIIGAFKHGFIQPLWSDVAIDMKEGELSYLFSNRSSVVTMHDSKQMPGFYEDYVILKFHTPWLFKSSEDLRMAIFEPFYMNNKPKPYITPYGIAETTNKVFTPNFFILLQKQKRKMLIETNTPMVQILPMTEKIVEIKNEVITENEYLKYWSYVAQRPYFFSYGLKSIKKNFFGEKSKCPFGK